MRKIFNVFLLSFFVISVMTIFNSSSVYACSCVEPQPVETELSRSDAVFSGRVLEVKEQTSIRGMMTKAALFEVDHIWKGGSESEIIIHTGSGGGDCGFEFEVGKEYLVYANHSTMYGDKELLVTIICDRTKLVDEAQEDLKILGEGKEPTVIVNLKDTFNREHPYLMFASIGIAILGTVIYLVWRKKQK